MSTTITISLAGKPCFQHTINRRMTEEEIHAVVEDGLIGIDKEQAEINIYHQF
jgi:hypothetical protein